MTATNINVGAVPQPPLCTVVTMASQRGFLSSLSQFHTWDGRAFPSQRRRRGGKSWRNFPIDNILGIGVSVGIIRRERVSSWFQEPFFSFRFLFFSETLIMEIEVWYRQRWSGGFLTVAPLSAYTAGGRR